MKYDVAIIGSGPAGMAAALYLLRAGKTVIMFEGEMVGGQLAKCPYIENYPGFMGTGGELADAMHQQLAAYPNFTLEYDDVIEIDRCHSFHIGTTSGMFKAYHVIYAAGVEHKHLPCLDHVMPHVHYCATCDGPLYKDKDVVVIGDANSALQYALELSNYCKSVALLTMFDRFFGEQILVDKVLANDKIRWFPNHTVEKIEELDNRLALTFSDTGFMFTEAVFVAIGQVPRLIDLPDGIETRKGFILVDKNFETDIKGFYAVGDCIQKDHRQVGLAVADGITAAMNIIGE